ncbi:MAG: sigma-70 family RNA polymerase sigma factor [Chloroflexi bacterium]|nr:sigma-70 family RNA polymerase sigma factor [Chloroflexota bacterium]
MLTAALPRREVDMTSGVDQTDRALVARCLANDPAALTKLVERHQRDVYGVCLRLTHDPDAALELANAVFYKAYRNLRGFDADRPLRPWLLRIATNETLNYLRDRRREQAQTLPGDTDAHLAAVPGGDDPAAVLESAEQRARVRAAVARLPEHYRLLITLRFFNDLSYAEIADQTGVPISTVGVQLMRARALLRRALAGEEVTDALSS